jgi:hypothetical protein
MFGTRYDVGAIQHPTPPAARLLAVWDRAGGDTARRPSVAVQLAVVQYCADVPGTPVPTLDDMHAVRALVDSLTV